MSIHETNEAEFWTDGATTDGGRLRRLAGWASVGMFLVWIGFSVLAFVWNVEQRSLLQRAKRDPFSVSLSEVRDSNARGTFLNHAFLVLLLVTAACFITWMYLEYRRAERAGATTRFAIGWAWGAWFVPILNWFRPYQVMEDVWGATAGRTRSRALIGAWWGFYVASIAAAIAAGSGDDARTIDEALSKNGFYVARAVLALVAAALAAVIVRAVLVACTRAELPTRSDAEV
jgi:hypothetical protein